MAGRTFNLDIDARPESTRSVARVAVSSFSGYTRAGTAPTITADCSDIEQFDAEVNRLRNELDSCLTRARSEWAGQEPGSTAKAAPALAPRRDAVSPLRVEDVMTRAPKTLKRTDTLAFADQLMRDGRFRHLIVLDDNGQIAGLVTRRDIFYGALTWSQGIGKRTFDVMLATTQAKEVMTSNITTVSPMTLLSTAADKMVEGRFSCLPVVHGVELVGVLTEVDFVALAREA